jgi:thiosulfate dehydrogenase (quinone)
MTQEDRMTAFPSANAQEQIAASGDWRAAAIAMLSVRIIQGFIYWGGGSRRFIYAPWKLDPDQSNWMANKFQTAMTGALFGKLGLGVLAFVLAFDIGIYNYYRGSVVTHGGPVSPTALSQATLLRNGGVRFHIYVDGGTPAAPAHIMKAELLGADGKTLASWDTAALSALPVSAIANDFAYNRFKAGPYGLAAAVGSVATITLPGDGVSKDIPGGAILRLTDVNGRTFTDALASER